MDTQTDQDVHIRWMIRRDMTAVLEIENDSFPSPWDKETFIRCLRQRNCIGMVAEHDDTVIGYMVYELHKHRIDILNFAVSPWVRRHGVGRQMVDKLKSKLSRNRRDHMELLVADSSLDAHLFFRAMGFRAVQVHREYWDDGQDAYEMVYRLKG